MYISTYISMDLRDKATQPSSLRVFFSFPNLSLPRPHSPAIIEVKPLYFSSCTAACLFGTFSSVCNTVHPCIHI